MLVTLDTSTGSAESPPLATTVAAPAVGAAPMDVIVIGAGVVGLAVARRLALAGRRVTVLEAEADFGLHTSGRGSWVIHSGLYYPADSFKAKLCQAGRHMLYAYCDARGVHFEKRGKIVVAVSDDQVSKLEALLENGHHNGATDLRWMPAEEACSLEPALHCVAALFSPATGVVDGRGVMQAFKEDAEACGARIIFNAKVLGGDVAGPVKAVQVENVRTGERQLLRADCIVNSAGLWAQHVAEGFAGLQRHLIPPLHLARGCYFRLKGEAPFKHLIYPIPEEAGLGTHLTLGVADDAKFGPDSQWIAWDPDEGPDYAVDPARCEKFYGAIRKYWPRLEDGQLEAGYSGIRPKLVGPGQPAADFVIQGAAEHGVLGLVNLFGIESPGLTSSMAIAEHVTQLLVDAVPPGGARPAAKL